MEPLRVLLADDHVLFRRGVAALLSARAGMEVVGEASDGLEAIACARETMPEVILMDISMPNCGGLEAVRTVKREMPHVRIIMLTVSDDDDDLFAAIKGGADGYLLKDLEPQQLFAMLEGVRRGEVPMSGPMAARILRELRQPGGRPVGRQELREELTPREMEVLAEVVKGATNREIAAALSITENTVKIHLCNILDKLHLQNRIQVAVYAVREGLVRDQPKEGPPSPPRGWGGGC